MHTIPLGRSELSTSRLAYGCWRIARADDTQIDRTIAREAIHAAIDAGFTLFDHADIYCDGRAESVFGDILRETPSLRSEMLIATKCGIRFRGEPTPGAPYRYDLSRDHILRQCEQSLRRLKVERIDIFQLHRHDALTPAEEVAGAFDELHRTGKVREFGVSNFLPSQVTLLQETCPRRLVVNQVEISLAQLNALDDGTLVQCQMEKLTPLAWSPLAGGLLADGATDILDAQKKYRPAEIVIALDAIAAERGLTRMTIALAWLLRHPAGIVPLVGSVNPERIRAAADAADVELSRDEWYRLLTAARPEPLP
jgi:predicted oxidoreductase